MSLTSPIYTRCLTLLNLIKATPSQKCRLSFWTSDQEEQLEDLYLLVSTNKYLFLPVTCLSSPTCAVQYASCGILAITAVH